MSRLLQLTPSILRPTTDAWAAAVSVRGRLWMSVHCLLFFSLVPVPRKPFSGHITVSCLPGPATYPRAYLVSMHLSRILDQSFQLPLCLLFLQLSPSIHLYVSTHLLLTATYTSWGPHYPSFICICIIHASSHLLSITSPAASLMSCTLLWGGGGGDEYCQACFPSSREQRHKRDMEGTERPLESR